MQESNEDRNAGSPQDVRKAPGADAPVASRNYGDGETQDLVAQLVVVIEELLVTLDRVVGKATAGSGGDRLIESALSSPVVREELGACAPELLKTYGQAAEAYTAWATWETRRQHEPRFVGDQEALVAAAERTLAADWEASDRLRKLTRDQVAAEVAQADATRQGDPDGALGTHGVMHAEGSIEAWFLRDGAPPVATARGTALAYSAALLFEWLRADGMESRSVNEWRDRFIAFGEEHGPEQVAGAAGDWSDR